jgi:hypothetical protein
MVFWKRSAARSSTMASAALGRMEATEMRAELLEEVAEAARIVIGDPFASEGILDGIEALRAAIARLDAAPKEGQHGS